MLIDMRRARGVSQVELARRLDTQQAAVSNIERRERRLDVVELCNICDALEVDVEEFVSRFNQARRGHSCAVVESR